MSQCHNAETKIRRHLDKNILVETLNYYSNLLDIFKEQCFVVIKLMQKLKDQFSETISNI